MGRVIVAPSQEHRPKLSAIGGLHFQTFVSQSNSNFSLGHWQFVDTLVSLEGVSGVEDSCAVLAGVGSWVVVDGAQVRAMHGTSLERGTAHSADERPATAVHQLVVRQIRLHTHRRTLTSRVTTCLENSEMSGEFCSCQGNVRDLSGKNIVREK